jgi:L-ascorbate metabolism protein UlaG (beta-lactamase superfamily)
MLRHALSCTLILACLPSLALAQERTPSHCLALAEAEGHVMPAAFGDPLAEDTVRLRYLDHSMYLLETAGGLIAVTDYTGYLGVPDVVPDVVTMNNAHPTHWTTRPDPRIPHVLLGWPDGGVPAAHDLDLGEMLVRNVTTNRRPRLGERDGEEANSIFIFEVAGLCIGHLGHLHVIPSDEEYAAIGRLDVLMVPVDGGVTMRVGDMAQVVRRLRSSVVLPMHWFSGTSLEVFLADMAAEFDVVRLDQPDIELSRDNLPSRPTIMVLQPAFLE